DAVIAASLAGSGAAHVFATNQLVVITPANYGQPAAVQSLADLVRPGVMLVLAAEDVPVGDYARAALANLESQFGAGYTEDVLANVVSSEDNVKQIVAKVQLGEADAGIVYKTDAAATPDLVSITIPAEYNVTARYPIAALANAPQPELAADFVTYVLSADGQAVLKKWGFGPAAP
ncbi:MAG: molybdate ABC transporter substrate-binding protein, partial [Chloroflexota bacterium]